MKNVEIKCRTMTKTNERTEIKDNERTKVYVFWPTRVLVVIFFVFLPEE